MVGKHREKGTTARTRNRGKMILKCIMEDTNRGLVMGYVYVACDFVTN